MQLNNGGAFILPLGVLAQLRTAILVEIKLVKSGWPFRTSFECTGVFSETPFRTTFECSGVFSETPFRTTFECSGVFSETPF